MKKILFILFLFITTNCYSVELLVRASPHYLDSLTQSEVDKMTVREKQSYEARSQIGDIIVVRPDNWQWGKEECLPTFIVVKVPYMTFEEAKKYEESLNEGFIDDKGEKQFRMLKVRKYQIPLADVAGAKTKGGILTKTKAKMIKNIIEKTK